MKKMNDNQFLSFQIDYLDLLKSSNKRKILSEDIGVRTELKKVSAFK